ncbi:relA/SpoT domain protein [Roseburia sp. CAG:309]|nr:GTP pyrophosphokinase family protein [Eubacterium sp.]CDD34176.1 relA/SpoT domain protein [Roseburia sp. CAG:309]
MLEQEVDTSLLNQIYIPADAGHVFIDQETEFRQMMMMYSCAIKEIKTKLQVLNDELSIKRQRNPIEFIKTRVKQPDSIASKLRRKGYPVTVQSVFENLSDVAGVRVICAFIDDIYKVADMLTAQDDIELIKRKDYIKNPKMNGYRSLHLIIEVPVFFSDHKEQIRVEVQIRTIAMDFWASLEHQLKYKKDIDDAESIMYELRACADVINRTDYHMQSLRDRIVENS